MKYELIKEYLGEGLLTKWIENGTWNQITQAMEAYHLEMKRLEKIESSSHIISSPQLDLNIVSERNKRYPRMEHGGFDSTLNEARREAFIEGAKYVKEQVDY